MPDGPAIIPGGQAEAGTGDASLRALRQVEIERSLIDVALLRTFVSSRNDTTLERAFAESSFPVKPPAETPTKDAFLRRLAELEGIGVEGLMRDPAGVAFLFGARDTLNAVAAPADAYTIAFTGLYSGGLPEAGTLRERPDFAEMRLQARLSKAAIGTLAAGGVIAVMLAVWLSVHALVGKTVLDQVGQTAAALAAIDKEIAAADTEALARLDPKPGIWMAIVPRLCERMSILPNLANPEPPLYGYEGPEHWLLCDRRREAKFRNDVAKSELATWIDTTLSPPMSWLPGLSVRNVEMHTSYTSEQVGRALLSSLGVYYLPVLFGLLGGAVYAVRRLNQKIVSSELHPRDWRHALFRIFMAFLLGGCIGLFFSPEGTKFDGPNGEITLSIAALSFLAGYSVEVVFRFFDMVITQALRVVHAVAPAATAGRAT
ncbi:hypothetical protein [Elioraea sp.]|uniref:hypothetical protein n=1 Tax=Elioraea sp. TaxID=2185103 RepID=UPI0021DF1FA0|nr:hypothetical protein [Elioraea sp.]GIX08502.1 MAG: hypothetical protein KatS3mg116_0212 [Elioraea sp.]